MRVANRFIFSGVSLAAMAASPAFAQTAQKEQIPTTSVLSSQETRQVTADQCVNAAPGARPSSCENQITVTGTRIRRPNLESALPVTSVGGQEFFQTGNVSVGDKLADLPSIRSTFTQSNSTRFLGTSGLNILDLRGLGTTRTLVLVNGRRHVGGDVLSSGVGVDINTIPADLIDRVDVVTGGNSAVYGSDAIAGVVNFVLKQNYDGIQLRGQAGQSMYGDYGSYFVSGLVGKNFAGGRGNVAVNVEYARRDQAFAGDRPWLRSQNGFIANDTDRAICQPGQITNCSTAGSDGNPDNIFVTDIRSASLSPFGTVRFGGTNLGTGAVSALNCGPSQFGTGSSAAFNCPYNFTQSGQLVPITGTRVGLGPTGSFLGGNGYARQAGQLLQLSPQLDRYNINMIGHFDISPALTPFVEAKFSRTDSVGTGGSGPSFITGSALGDTAQIPNFGCPSNVPAAGCGGIGVNRERIALNNPYLDPNVATFIANQILASGVNDCTFTTLTASQRTAIANRTYRFCLRENMEGLGSRVEEARRDTFRIVGGLKGDFNDDWHYEVAANYGHLKEKTVINGNLDVQRFLLANDAVRDPATGQIRCASQIDPTHALGTAPFYYGTDPNAAARLAADVAACTPINPIGGQFTDAQRAYLLRNTVAKGSTTQFDVSGFVSGNTGKFFNLPGGAIGFVLGAEYRTDNLTYDLDKDTQLGYTFYNAIPTFRAPKQKVKEAFGEISLPFFRDRHFLQELEVDAAARVSHYNTGSTGTVWAYNVNGIYSPFKGLRLRGNYARAVRAPNQAELFSPAGQNFAPGFTDPCSAININSGTQFRAANCAAAGIPATYDFRYSSSLAFQSGGNPNLQAEKSDSYTYGFVAQPHFLPGFTVSADYYNIKIANAISFVGAQAVANACYDQPTFPNVFCSQFTRAGPSGQGTAQPFQIIEGSLLAAPLNYAKLTAKGIDTEIAYRHDFRGIGRFDTRLTWTHVINRSDYTSTTDPNFENSTLR